MSDTHDTERIRTEAHHPAPAWSGSAFGLAILALAVACASWYAWYRVHTPPSVELSPSVRINDEPETVRAHADVAILESMSPSDEIPMIQSDLEATTFNSIDADLQAIDAELGAFESKLRAP